MAYSSVLMSNESLCFQVEAASFLRVHTQAYKEERHIRVTPSAFVYLFGALVKFKRKKAVYF